MNDQYRADIEHPRYGRGPRFTNVIPETVPLGYNLTSYISDGLIPNTAVAADLDCQTPTPVPALYYFDLKRVCVDCTHSFIFFAEEQKYWYETLGYTLDSDCVRCVPCRKQQQDIACKRKWYEQLYHLQNRTTEENLEMADCCLTLIEANVFHRKQFQHVRMILNRIQIESDEKTQNRLNDLRTRMVSLES